MIDLTESRLVATARLEPLGAIASGVVIASLYLLADILGALVGLTVAAAWVAFGAPGAIAVGHVMLVAIVPTPLDLGSLALAEVGFVALVVAPLLRTDHRTTAILTAVVALGLVGGLAWLGLAVADAWGGAALALGAIAVLAYAVHRYSLLALDKFDAEVTPS